MWRVVDISESGRMLSLSRGSLTVASDGLEVGRVPLKDIQCVLVHGHGTTVSLSLGAALADEGIPLVMCGRDHFPRAISLPVSGNFEQAARLSGQASLPLPKRKQIWRKVVQTKIFSQARTLEYVGHPDHAALKKLVKSVRSGDPGNVEARAARYYWRRLLGEKFRRDVDAGGLNSHLNYGYTVVRAAMARAVVGAGLAPGLGLHHRTRLNAFQLVDDLMEPFRCLIDQCVWRNRGDWTADVMPDAKAELADVINFTMPTMRGSSSASRMMSALALSLAEICTGTGGELDFPRDWVGQDQKELDLD